MTQRRNRPQPRRIRPKVITKQDLWAEIHMLRELVSSTQREASAARIELIKANAEARKKKKPWKLVAAYILMGLLGYTLGLLR